MTDNRNTQEAAGLRRKSEFIRQVEDFAMYMQKEYLDPSDNLALLVCAADAGIDGGGRCGSAAIMLGDRWVGLTSLASMMRRKEFAEVFRKARVLSTEDGDDGGMGDAMRGVRRRLRVDYSIEAGVALWSVLLAVLMAFGLMDWFTMVSNLILMAWTACIVGRDIMPLRRRLVSDFQYFRLSAIATAGKIWPPVPPHTNRNFFIIQPSLYQNRRTYRRSFSRRPHRARLFSFPSRTWKYSTGFQ